MTSISICWIVNLVFNFLFCFLECVKYWYYKAEGEWISFQLNIFILLFFPSFNPSTHALKWLNFKITMNCMSWLQGHSASKIGGRGGRASILKSNDTNSSKVIQNGHFKDPGKLCFKLFEHVHELSDHMFQMHAQHINQIYLGISVFNWRKHTAIVRRLSSL